MRDFVEPLIFEKLQESFTADNIAAIGIRMSLMFLLRPFQEILHGLIERRRRLRFVYPYFAFRQFGLVGRLDLFGYPLVSLPSGLLDVLTIPNEMEPIDFTGLEDGHNYFLPFFDSFCSCSC